MMVKQEHLEVIRCSTIAWNRWRRKHLMVQPDLTEADLHSAKENKTGKLVLFPIKLDNTVMEINQAWAADIYRTRHIGDFTRWKEHDEYQKGLSRLLRDLKQDAVK